METNVTMQWFYLQVGKQLVVDIQACVITVVFVSRYLQQLIFLNVQLGDVQINIVVLGDNSSKEYQQHQKY